MEPTPVLGLSPPKPRCDRPGVSLIDRLGLGIVLLRLGLGLGLGLGIVLQRLGLGLGIVAKYHYYQGANQDTWEV